MAAGRPSSNRTGQQSACDLSATERRVSWFILAVLAVVVAGVFRAQYSFNPAVLVAKDANQSKAGSESKSDVTWLPAELKPLSPPESFTPEKLYDKIDGKAELYLSAGIAGMRCQRFALKTASDQ